MELSRYYQFPQHKIPRIKKLDGFRFLIVLCLLLCFHMAFSQETWNRPAIITLEPSFELSENFFTRSQRQRGYNNSASIYNYVNVFPFKKHPNISIRGGIGLEYFESQDYVIDPFDILVTKIYTQQSNLFSANLGVARYFNVSREKDKIKLYGLLLFNSLLGEFTWTETYDSNIGSRHGFSGSRSVNRASLIGGILFRIADKWYLNSDVCFLSYTTLRDKSTISDFTIEASDWKFGIKPSFNLGINFLFTQKIKTKK